MAGRCKFVRGMVGSMVVRQDPGIDPRIPKFLGSQVLWIPRCKVHMKTSRDAGHCYLKGRVFCTAHICLQVCKLMQIIFVYHWHIFKYRRYTWYRNHTWYWNVTVITHPFCFRRKTPKKCTSLPTNQVKVLVRNWWNVSELTMIAIISLRAILMCLCIRRIASSQIPSPLFADANVLCKIWRSLDERFGVRKKYNAHIFVLQCLVFFSEAFKCSGESSYLSNQC